MDKILVTGVAGLIGSNLALELLKDEKNYVIGIDDFSNSSISTLYQLLKNDRFMFIEQDIKDEINQNCDYIYNFAGNGDLSKYFENKYKFTTDSIEMNKNIIDLAIKNGCQLITPTSFISYNEQNKDLKEYNNLIKLLEDMYLDLIRNNKLNCRLVRIMNTYGKYMNNKDTRFIFQTILNVFSNENIVLENDEKTFYTYLDDLIINLIKLKDNYEQNEIVDIISNQPVLKSDIVNLIIEYSKSNSKIQILSPSIIDSTNFINTKYSCNTRITDGIKETIKYYDLMLNQ